MASSNIDLAQMGGRVNFDVGQLMYASDVDRQGGIALQSLLHILEILFFDEAQGEPISGFPRDQLTTDHCQVSATSDLGWSVSTGWGMYFDGSATVDPFGPARYLPIVLDTAATGTLSAHHATLPRLDLLCIAPTWVADQSASRLVKDTGTGVVSSSTIAQRLRFGATVQVVAGTPAASPTVPATPAGYLPIGVALVPATTGAASWSDVRPVLELGSHLKALPRYACANYIPLGGNTELQVSATSPASMKVEVARGRAVIAGVCRFYQAAVYPALTIGASHATLYRKDLIVAKDDGTLAVVAGTPSGLPSLPAVPAGAVALAEVQIDPTVTTIVSGKIVDMRAREPFDGDTHLQEGSVTPSRLEYPSYAVTVTAGTLSGEVYPIDIVLSHLDGAAMPDGVYTLMAEIWEKGPVVGSTPGDYGQAAGANIEKYTTPPTGSPATFVLANGTGTVGTLFAGPMTFTCDENGTTISVRRKDSADVGTVLVRVTLLGHPAANDAIVELVFP